MEVVILMKGKVEKVLEIVIQMELRARSGVKWWRSVLEQVVRRLAREVVGLRSESRLLLLWRVKAWGCRVRGRREILVLRKVPVGM